MTKTTIGLLHPREVGSAVGSAARAAGMCCLASEGRSQLFQKATVTVVHLTVVVLFNAPYFHLSNPFKSLGLDIRMPL